MWIILIFVGIIGIVINVANQWSKGKKKQQVQPPHRHTMSIQREWEQARRNNISQKEQDELRKLRFNNVPEKYPYKPDQDKKNDSTDGGGELYNSDDKIKR